MRLTKVEVLRESIKIIIGALSEKSVPITQVGSRAFVEWHPVTGRPKRINIPYVPDNASDRLIKAVQGFVDHECAHVLFTDFECVKMAVKSGAGMVGNILEDTYIEREMKKLYAGSRHNLLEVWGFLAEEMLKEPIDAAIAEGHRAKIVASGLPIAIHAWAGNEAAEEFMATRWDAFAEIKKIIGDDIIDEIPNVTSSKEGLLLAVAMKNRLLEWKEKEEREEKERRKKEREKEREKEKKESECEGEPDPEGGSSDPDMDDAIDPDSDGDGDGDGDGEGDSPMGDDDAEDSIDGDEDCDPGDSGDEEDDFDEDDEDFRPSDPRSEEEEEEFEDDSETEGSSDDDDEEGDKPEEDKAEDFESTFNPETHNPEDDEEGDEPEDEADESGEKDGDVSGGDADEKSVDEEGKKSESDEEHGTAFPEGPPEPVEETEEEEVDMSDFESEAEEILEAMEDMEDMEAVSNELIGEEMDRALSTTDYWPLTKDADVIERYTPTDVNPTYVRKRQDEISKHIGHITKRLQRMIQAKSYDRKIPGFRSGKLDGAALHRVPTGDDRVFRRVHRMTTKDVDVQLVVDLSGSMSGSKVELATEVAYAVGLPLDRLGINNQIVGFTTKDMTLLTHHEKIIEENHEGREPSRYEPIYMPILKDWNQGFTPDRQTAVIMSATDVNLWNNIDGESVEYAGRMLWAQPGARKLMIVLSDGCPMAHGNISEQAVHLRRVVRRLEAAGTEVFGIGIMDDNVKRFYKNAVVIRHLDEVLSTVMGVLEGMLMRGTL